MSKDPAFLFYGDNFMSGTMFLSDDQVGKYIRLICAQHLTGHIHEKDMLKICKTHDIDIWSKFTKDQDGKYYNLRLEQEIMKRKAFSESRSHNRKGKGKNTRITSVKHLGNENGIINEDIFLEYCKEFLKEKYISLEVSLKAKYNQWKEAGWKDGYDKEIKNWKTKIQNTIPHLKQTTNDKHRIDPQRLNLPEGTEPIYKKD